MKIILNPDRFHVEEVREALARNDGYCPCKLLHNQDTKCMCKEFRDMIAEGEPCECHCGLYQIIK